MLAYYLDRLRSTADGDGLLPGSRARPLRRSAERRQSAPLYRICLCCLWLAALPGSRADGISVIPAARQWGICCSLCWIKQMSPAGSDWATAREGLNWRPPRKEMTMKTGALMLAGLLSLPFFGGISSPPKPAICRLWMPRAKDFAKRSAPCWPAARKRTPPGPMA